MDWELIDALFYALCDSAEFTADPEVVQKYRDEWAALRASDSSPSAGYVYLLKSGLMGSGADHDQ